MTPIITNEITTIVIRRYVHNYPLELLSVKKALKKFELPHMAHAHSLSKGCTKKFKKRK